VFIISNGIENREPEKDSGTTLSRLKMWVCSGEILTTDLLLEFYNYFPAGTIICNYYGSTEVMGDVTYAVFKSRQEVVDALVENKVPIGRVNILKIKKNR
jgi:acyl-coenzyme A synthetase/AMP-(fatty) acid ligase